MLKHRAVTQSMLQMLKHRAVTQSRSQMLKHRVVTQSEVADAETQSCTQSRVADAETQNCYTVQGRRCWNTKLYTVQSRWCWNTELLHIPESQMLKHRGDRHNQRAETQGSRYSQWSTSTNHRSYIRKPTQSRAQFTWLKQPMNYDAETTSVATRKSCYSSCNNNISSSSCNSISVAWD